MFRKISLRPSWCHWTSHLVRPTVKNLNIFKKKTQILTYEKLKTSIFVNIFLKIYSNDGSVNKILWIDSFSYRLIDLSRTNRNWNTGKTTKETAAIILHAKTNTAANMITHPSLGIITGCNFMLITLWFKKKFLDVKSEDAFPHSAPVSASHHHPIIHNLTVHLLSPLPPPPLQQSVRGQ